MNKIKEALKAIETPKQCHSEDAAGSMASFVLLQHHDTIKAALNIALNIEAIWREGWNSGCMHTGDSRVAHQTWLDSAANKAIKELPS